MFKIITTKRFKKMKFLPREMLLEMRSLNIFIDQLLRKVIFLNEELGNTVQEAYILEWRNREELILNFQHQFLEDSRLPKSIKLGDLSIKY